MRSLFAIRPIAVILFAIFLSLAMPAAADALDDALRNGKVGETPRGYIAPVGSPSRAISDLVADINKRRRAQYLAIARKNNMSLPQIEAVAGERIIQRAAAGTYYKDAKGRWQRK